MESTTGPVVSMAILRVVDPQGFATLKPQFDAATRTSDGYLADREFSAFFALAPEHDPAQPVLVGLVEYASSEALTAVRSGLILDGAVASAYAATVDTLADVAMRPRDPADTYALDSLVEPGQVLEVAVRDLSAYEDRDAFFGTIGAFIELLIAQPGVVREYQWLSLDGDTFVGMTVYEDMAAFSAISQDQAVMGSAEAGALFAAYPPVVAQYLLETDAA